jgi:tetratricopeptide (TPR) repeat protein
LANLDSWSHFFAVTACVAFGAWAQSPIERARALLAAGNAKQAYAELAPLAREMAGNAEFDYLLGVAALDSGRIDEAIVAFERVLALIPQHAGAQMDLARAYYALGSYDLAEAAFIRLREANPPRPTLAAINRYLEAVKERRHEATPGFKGYGELAIGYDSNLTGVPSDFGAARTAPSAFPASRRRETRSSVRPRSCRA